MRAPLRSSLLALLLLTALPALAARTDRLPSWNDGPAKRAILAFLDAATREGGAGYIPPQQRLAVFDHDGTLWSEQPVAQGVFILEQLKARVAQDPSLRQRPVVEAALAKEHAYFEEHGARAVVELMPLTEAGLSDAQYEAQVRRFLGSAQHPRLGVPYPATSYVPMLELLELLRASGFQTWISTGGGVDFVRVLAPDTYGVEREQVIGSSLKKEPRQQEGREVLVRTDQLLTFNDGPQQAANLAQQLGQRPALAVGNVRSGGDVAMLAYSKGREGPSLQLLVNHDDARREFAYAEKDGASLAAARAQGFTVVSMKRDWQSVFGVGTRLLGKGPAQVPTRKDAP